jgi:hypothetical protein
VPNADNAEQVVSKWQLTSDQKRVLAKRLASQADMFNPENIGGSISIYKCIQAANLYYVAGSMLEENGQRDEETARLYANAAESYARAHNHDLPGMPNMGLNAKAIDALNKANAIYRTLRMPEMPIPRLR